MFVLRYRAVPVLCAAARYLETPGAAPKDHAGPSFFSPVPEYELHLRFECIRQRSITSLALAQLSLNSFTWGDVPGNFRRALQARAVQDVHRR
jgi:hypothetical protein